MPPIEPPLAPKSDPGPPRPMTNRPGPAVPSSVSNRDSNSSGSQPARAEPLSHRDDIPIPDFQLLRRIGSGAYGEVWLARAITGALRVVKVVWLSLILFCCCCC